MGPARAAVIGGKAGLRPSFATIAAAWRARRELRDKTLSAGNHLEPQAAAPRIDQRGIAVPLLLAHRGTEQGRHAAEPRRWRRRGDAQHRHRRERGKIHLPEAAAAARRRGVIACAVDDARRPLGAPQLGEKRESTMAATAVRRLPGFVHSARALRLRAASTSA